MRMLIGPRRVLLLLAIFGIFCLSFNGLAQITKDPVESDRIVSLTAINPSFYANTDVREFAEISVTQDSFVYLIDFAPQGQNTLLLGPSRLTSNLYIKSGKSYVWPRDFTSEAFKVPANTGQHTIQAIATPSPINLLAPADTSPATFTILGTDPDAVRANLEQLISDHAISNGSWSAHSDSIIIDSLPLTGSGSDPSDVFADVRLFVVDDQGAAVALDFQPKVKADTNSQIGFTITMDGNADGTRVNNLRRDNTHVTLTPSALFHNLQPGNPCKLEAQPVTKTLSACALSSSDLAFRGTIKLTFTLNRQSDPVAVFNVRPTDVQVGQSVNFEASTAGNASITSYQWRFGDTSAPQKTNTPNVDHIYASAGTFPATLTIFTSDGRTITSSSQNVFVGSDTPICANQQTLQAGICLDRLTGDFTTIVSPKDGSVLGSTGAASLLYVSIPQSGDTTMPEGPAVGEVHYQVTMSPADASIRNGKVEMESRLIIHYLNQDPSQSSTEPLSDPFFINLSQVPQLNSDQVKSFRMIIPRGTVAVQYQFFTNISINETQEKFGIGFSGLRFQSTACGSSFAQTDRPTYKVGDRIYFSFCNLGSADVTLSSSAPWVIKNSSGQVVFTPIALQQQITLKSGQYVLGSWDQRTDTQTQVQPGFYTLEFSVGGTPFSTTFQIQP
ncbi:PKD domain-containing protein [Candidatus Acetothermia bacterium]|nr:PKD domain-containing protein [Candidatus Acetothermia bacterium]